MTPPLTHEFVPRQEALRLFALAGFSPSTFDREARKHIESQPKQKGERGRRYSLADIRAVLQARIGQEEKVPTPPFHFRRMTVEDMPEVAELLTGIFPGKPDVAQWQERIRANDEIGYVVTSGGKIEGCGFLMIHTREWIEHLFTQEITPITYPTDILPLVPGTPVCVYVRTVAVRQQGVPKSVRHRWASVLIAGLLRTIVNWGSRGIIIDRIYGRSDTKDGEHMLHELGFTRRKTTTSHENFEIDVARSGLRFIKRYDKAYLEWQKQHSSL